MFTVTMRRTLVVLSIVAPLAAAPRFARAQGAVIIRTDGSGIFGGSANTIVRRVLPISDDTVKSLIERFEPGVLDDETADANVVTIVLDHDGTYVRSSTRHAKVVQAEPAQIVSLNGDSVRAFVLPRAAEGVATLQGLQNGVISIQSLKQRAETLGEPLSVMGTGFAADEVEAISTKRYAAGTLGKSQLIVTMVRLR